MNDIRFNKFAQLIIGSGVNIQKDEYLIIEAPVDCAEFVRELTKVALEKGAKDVAVYYNDPYVDLERLQHCDHDQVAEVKEFEKQSLSWYLEKGAASLLIKSAYPYLYADCSESMNAALADHTNNKRNVIRFASAASGNKWCIATYPNKMWAKTLYPELSEDEAFDALLNLFYDICRVDAENDPNENWKKHCDTIAENGKKLEALDIDYLHFKNGIGTDLTIGLMPGARFGMGGKMRNYPNIPTEEVATTPDKYRVNGTVVASKPLELGGAIIENFGFTFKDGRLTDFYAEKNKGVLENAVNTDEGSHYLGEVALVGYDTPISLSNKIFFNTLIDENASCHLALGKGFPMAVGVRSNDPAEIEAAHCNMSKIHLDFMFGTADMSVVAVDRNGGRHQVFENGCFVL
ncbi:MAG: aminopeptidase [Firmicutes bacterium]|nr:aminopeptidase [Bacillota bacterium]